MKFKVEYMETISKTTEIEAESLKNLKAIIKENGNFIHKYEEETLSLKARILDDDDFAIETIQLI